MGKYLAYILYYCFAIYLPNSDLRMFGKPSGKLRGFLFRKITNNSIREVGIQKQAVFSSKVSVGKHSNIGLRCKVESYTTIGDYVMMGPDVSIYTTNHETSNIEIPMCFQGNAKLKEVIIGNDVWIGTRSIILPGVRIGDGSIIGAGSIVTKDVPANAVVGGNPAKVIKYRNGLNPQSEHML